MSGGVALFWTVPLLRSKVKLFVRRGKGDTPHCPECDYCLTGAVSARCPECGTPWYPETVTFGRKRPRVIPFLQLGLAVLLWLIFLHMTVDYVSGDSHYAQLPTSTLIRDVRSADPERCCGALRVLETRQVLGKLIPGEERGLVEASFGALETLTDAPARRQVIDFLDGPFAQKTMPARERAKLTEIKRRGTTTSPTSLP